MWYEKRFSWPITLDQSSNSDIAANHKRSDIKSINGKMAKSKEINFVWNIASSRISINFDIYRISVCGASEAKKYLQLIGVMWSMKWNIK